MTMTITNSTTMEDKARWMCNKYISCVNIKKSSHPVRAEAFGRTCLGFSPLWLRIFIGLWAAVIIMWSAVLFRGPLYFWPIYMTHWGLLLILFKSIFGVAVALSKKRDYLKDYTSRLPWYVKVYWVLYNISIPIAFLITIFYWSLLSRRRVIAIPFALNVNLHGINSALMALELAVAAHPSRLAHCYQPLTVCLLYALFGIAYYFAGGVDPYGHPWIYPMVDWSNPKPTSVVVTLTALSMVVVHVAVVALASTRDGIVAYCRRNTDEVYEEKYTSDIVA